MLTVVAGVVGIRMHGATPQSKLIRDPVVRIYDYLGSAFDRHIQKRWFQVRKRVCFESSTESDDLYIVVMEK